MSTQWELDQTTSPKQTWVVESEGQTPSVQTPKHTQDKKDIENAKSKKEFTIEREKRKINIQESSGVAQSSRSVQESDKKDTEVVLRRSTRVKKPRTLFTL